MKALVLVVALVGLVALAGSASAEPLTFGVNLGFDARLINPGPHDQSANQGASLDVEIGAALTPRLELTGFGRLRQTWFGDSDTFGSNGDELWLGGRFHVLVSRAVFVGAGVAWLAAAGRNNEDTTTGMALEAHVGTRIPAGRIAFEPLLELGRIDLSLPSQVFYLRAAVGLRW